MTIRKWIHLFFSTLLIGAVSALIVGQIMQQSDPDFRFLDLPGMGFNALTMILAGLMFSIVSQMGFLAYLTLNYIAVTIFRKKYWWHLVQLLLTIVGLFELFYLRFLGLEDNAGWVHLIWPPLVLLVVGVAVTYWKVRMTNASAWIPTLFFMTVVTAIEAVSAFQGDNELAIWYMLIPLLSCNAWQILRLHKMAR